MLRLPVGYRVPLGMVGCNSPRQECNDVSDIRETLDQLDLRLDDLRRQVAALGADPEPAAPPVPPPSRRLHSVPAPSPELTDFASPPTPPGLEQASTDSPAAATDADSVQPGTDMRQLMAVRDQLLAGARELVRAYDRQLDLLENMAVSGLPATPAPPTPPAAPSSSPQGPSAAPGLFPSLSVVADQTRPAFFEGTVELLVSGAHRIQTIQVLQDALSRARHVDQVYVRRCHRGQVRLELSLSGGAELLGEFNRVLPFPFAVTSATRTEIALSLEGQQ